MPCAGPHVLIHMSHILQYGVKINYYAEQTFVVGYTVFTLSTRLSDHVSVRERFNVVLFILKKNLVQFETVLNNDHTCLK